MSPWRDIECAVAAATVSPFSIDSRVPVGGGYPHLAEAMVDRLLAQI